MTVMNNTFLSIEALYSEKDIQAVSNAFQQYGREQQINLLNRMPLEDAVLVLGQCSPVSYTHLTLPTMDHV